MQAEEPLTPAWTNLEYHPEQSRLWRSGSRFKAVSAGRGSGKTEIAKRRLVLSLLAPRPWPDPRYFYAAPTYAQAKRVAWDHLISLTPRYMVRRIDRSELYIESVYGSRLYVVGMERPERIEGNQWDGGVVDESSDIKPGTFDRSISPALTHRKGWCWRIGIPKRFGVGAVEYREFCERAARGELDDTEFFTWYSEDIVPKEAIEWARRNLDQKDFREQFQGSWESAGGGIFYAFDRQFNVRPVTYNSKDAIIVGCDFNVDPMAWCLGHAYSDRIEWFDELFIRNTNTQSALDALWKRYESHKGGWQFFGDATSDSRKTSASKSDYQQIYNDQRFIGAGRTVHFPDSNPAVSDRFAWTNAMWCNAEGQCRMFVDPSCKQIIRDTESRYYKPGTREAEDGGDLGHMTDALGYVVSALFPVRVEAPKTKDSVYIHRPNW